jgi:hypothetical protein
MSRPLEALTRHRSSLPIRSLVAVLGALLVLCFAPHAEAGGRVVWKSTTLQENKGREAWRFDLEIHMSAAPDVAFVPMKFEFKPTAVYERSLVDGREEPMVRTLPLTNQQSIIETFDVGFLDAGTGTIQSRTRFSAKVTRAHDFAAGEYLVTIKDARTGAPIGSQTRLVLQGENPVIDRRSITFHGGDEKKKEKPAEEKTAEQPGEAAAAPEPEPQPEPEPEPSDAGQTPPAVEERPGGGCHNAPLHGSDLGWLGLGLVLGAVLVLRRSGNL